MESKRYIELGLFLKSRRERLKPADFGLLFTGRRRTPGLRREEVALLAGIGLTWYTWLEQGRPIQVSSYTLECLSRVFSWNEEERNHVYRLAQLVPPVLPLRPGRPPESLQRLLDQLEGFPTLVADQSWGVVAWNQAATVVFGDLATMDERERNILWAVFAVPSYRHLMLDWEVHARNLVARFRSSFVQRIDDPRISQLVNELQTVSPEFACWWRDQEVQAQNEKQKRLQLPSGKILCFDILSLSVADVPGLTMIAHIPQRGTGTLEALTEILKKKPTPIRSWL